MLKLAVLGNPIAHSRSPEIHKAFALQAGICLDYQKIWVPMGGFIKAAQAFIEAGGVGFNITAPFKHEAFLWATTHSPRALLAQSVNTLKLNADGSCYGDNTDGAGFMADLIVNKNFNVRAKKIVIHGAGGAVCGIIPALLAQAPQQLFLMNRTDQKALELVQRFLPLGPIQAIAYGTALTAIDVIINGSSIACQDFNGLSSVQCRADARAYDLSYAHKPTPFMAWATARGIKHSYDGFGMLIEQAALSFQLWTKFRPNTLLMHDICSSMRRD